MSWEQLLDIYREAAQLAEQDANTPPSDCPNDGTTLVSNSDGVLGCTFCGWRFNQGF